MTGKAVVPPFVNQCYKTTGTIAQGGSFYWGDLYRYIHGEGIAQPLFFVSGTSPPAGVSLGFVGGDTWEVLTTPVP